jgi:segregation and condensation protein B
MKLESKIESLLFYLGEPISIKELAKILTVEVSEIETAKNELKNSLGERGIVLIENDAHLSLGTHPSIANLIAEIRKEELSKELSKASLETLAIILYKNEGITRSDIDYIRGVNSSFILRNLSIRGLVEKVPHETDNRKLVYKPTNDLLQFLGITNTESLPEYNEIIQKLSSVSNPEEQKGAEI